MREEITNLEKENNQLNQDLNKAVDLLEEKDREIAEIKQTISNLETKIAEQDKTIEELKNPVKVKQEPSETKHFLFTCDICDQNKKSRLHLFRVNGLGIDPLKQNK